MKFSVWLSENLAPLAMCQFAFDKTLQQFWDQCERADWLIWLVKNTTDRQGVVLREICREVSYMVIYHRGATVPPAMHTPICAKIKETYYIQNILEAAQCE